MKMLVVLGTRPEAIKLFPVVTCLRAETSFQVKVCITAQHRNLLDQILNQIDLAADYDLDLMKPNQNLTDLTARIICEVGKILDEFKPDRIMVQGDTTTAMASAMAAFYRKIPVDHVEAGLRSGDLYSPWPEELNRKVIGSLAALHFAPTARAAEALIRENVPRERIFVTGNTVIDALLMTKSKLDEFAWVHDAIGWPHFPRSDKRRMILVTTHRRENFDHGIQNIVSALNKIARRNDCTIVFPVHPNPNVELPVRSALGQISNIQLLPPLDYRAFVRALSAAHFVLTDSGGVQEEAPALGKPVLIMRDTTERPEAIDAGTALLVGTDPDRIVSEAFRLLDDDTHYKRMSRAHNPFGDGNASKRICRILKAEMNLIEHSAVETLRYAS
jgi:UDP-N-acetylglucosamine 2-epimerase (non-hydrolysing)